MQLGLLMARPCTPYELVMFNKPKAQERRTQFAPGLLSGRVPPSALSQEAERARQLARALVAAQALRLHGETGEQRLGCLPESVLEFTLAASSVIAEIRPSSLAAKRYKGSSSISIGLLISAC